MNKFLLSLCAVSLALGSSAQQQYWPKKAFKNVTPTTTSISTSASSTEATIVAQEDFSLFTAGSEDAPDNTNIAPGTNYLYVIDENYTHTPGWGGYHVYQAGGTCALKQYTDPYWGMTSYGHIQTPESELYGSATIKFRARRANSNPTSGDIDLALCDNNSGRLETTSITLTDEWAEYSWTSEKGTFNARNIFQITPVNGEILIDDIVVTRVRNKIPSVYALSARNISPTEFVAQWEASELPNIDGYLLSVYYKDFPENAVEPGSVSCDFESINLVEGGNNIDTANPNYPDGWTIDVSSNGSQDMCTTAGDFNSGKQGINFDAEGDYILSPVTPAPINKISFWIKPSNMEYESYDYSLVGVEVKNEAGKWEHIANIPNYWMSAAGDYYVIEGDAVGHYINQVRISCSSSYSVTFAIDDIQLDYAIQKIPYSLFTDKLVTGTEYTVSGIDPSKEHYYYVKVKEGELVSEPSYDVWVDGINGVTPTAKPASNLTQSGFTANWDKIYNASHYKLTINQLYTTSADNEEVVLVEEDFAGLTEGTIDSPHNPWTMSHNLSDNGQSDQDWSLTNPQWANGMAGSTGTSWSGAAGLVLSPKLLLGNNTIKVDVTALNTVASDKLWIMLIEDYSSTSAIVGKTLDFSTTEIGSISGTVTFESADFADFTDKPVHIAFMSQEGAGFFVDYAKISAISATKGSVIERPYLVAQPTDNYYTLESLPEGITTYKYNVVAKRTKDFVNYESNVSETITVVLPSASLNDIDADAVVVYTSGNSLVVKTQDDVEVAVYNIQGQLIASQVVNGESAIELTSGIYVATINNKTYKVAIK